MSTTPAITKARKLAAFLAPDSGASDSERENAAAMLQRLMEKTGLSMADITGDERKPCIMTCTSKDHLRLAAQIARWIMDDAKLEVRVLETSRTEYTRTGRAKRVKVWEVHINLTPAENLEWLRVFDHYRQHFDATTRALKATAAAAAKAVKMALPAFCSRHEIFPANAGHGKPLTPRQAAAFREAWAHAQGRKYQPAAQQLTA